MSTHQTYSKYKGSGLPYVGEIPIHWVVSKIKHVAPFQVGWTPPTGNDENFIGNNLWANISDLKVKVLSDTEKRISDSAAKVASMDITPAGALLYSFKLSVGAVSFANVDMYTNEAIASFLHNDRIPLGYLYYALPKFVIENASTNIYGARILNQELIKSAVLIVPPYTEAQAIADFLDHKTAKIDTLIEKQQQLIKLLKEKRLAVISHAVTKGLNPYAPMKDSGVEWLGEVPEHWHTSRVKQVSSFITSGPRGWSDYICDEGLETFLQSGDLNNELEILLNQAKRVSPPRGSEGVRTKLSAGDIVVCITGANTGRVAVVSKIESITYINQHLSLVRPIKDIIDSQYLGYALASKGGRSFFDVTQYGLKEGLSLSNVGEVPLAVPPLAEQKEIVDLLNRKLTALKKLTKQAELQIDLLSERRTALISAAVTGKIDVRNFKADRSDAA